MTREHGFRVTPHPSSVAFVGRHFILPRAPATTHPSATNERRCLLHHAMGVPGAARRLRGVKENRYV